MPDLPDDGAGATSPPAQGPLVGENPVWRKRSGGTSPSDGDVAAYSAARGFLAAEWVGAVLMVASFTFLYLLPFAAGAPVGITYGACSILLLAGTVIFLRTRAYYQRIGMDVAPRLHAVAALLAGSAGIFWLLFLLLVVLAALGIPLL